MTATVRLGYIMAPEMFNHGEPPAWVSLEDFRTEARRAQKESLGWKSVADANDAALMEVRLALGLSEHDVHEMVIDTIKRLRGVLS